MSSLLERFTNVLKRMKNSHYHEYDKKYYGAVITGLSPESGKDHVTVSDLKKLLGTCDNHARVYFQLQVGCCGDYIDLDISDVESMNFASTKEQKAGKNERSPMFSFKNTVPGYRSCRQWGKTGRDHDEYWKRFDRKGEK